MGTGGRYALTSVTGGGWGGGGGVEGVVFPFCSTRNVIGKAIGVLRALKLLKMSGSFHLFQMGRSPESRWKHPLHMRSLNLPHRTIVGENHYPNLPQETSRISVDAVAPVRHWRFLKEKKKPGHWGDSVEAPPGRAPAAQR